MIKTSLYCQPEFSRRISQRLIDRKLSRVQLADQCGINRTRLYEWLGGRFPLPEIEVNAVCDFLNICD